MAVKTWKTALSRQRFNRSAQNLYCRSNIIKG